MNWGDRPLWTRDCCWHCGVDVLAETRRLDPVGTVELSHRDPLGVEGDLTARVYSLEACGDSFGNRYWGTSRSPITSEAGSSGSATIGAA